MAIPLELGQAMRARREQLGLSQAALARRLGVSRPYVGNVESGLADWEPSLERLVDWSIALAWEPDAIARQAGRVVARGEVDFDVNLLGTGGLEAIRREVAAGVRDGILAALDELRAAAPPVADAGADRRVRRGRARS